MRLLLLVVLLGVCGCLASRDQIPTALANPTARVIAGISADTSTAELNDAVDELQTRAAAEAMGYMFPKQAMDEPVLNQKDLPENADHATGTWGQREKQNMQKLQTIADMARTSSFLQVSEEAEEADDLTADDLKAVEEAEEDLKNSKDGDDDDISLGAANADVPADLPLSTPKHVHRHRFHAPKSSEANDLSDAELDSLIKGSGVDAKAVEEDAKKMSEAEVEKALQAAEKAPVPTAAAAAPAQAPKAAVAPSQPASAVAAPAKAPVTTAPAVAAKAPTKAATAAPAPSSPSVTDLIGGALKNSPVMKQAAAEIPADQLKIHQEMDDELKALNDVLGQAEQLVEPVKKAADVIKAESLKVTDTAKQLKAVVDDATKDIPAVSDKELNSILGLGKDGKAAKETKKAEAAAPKAPEVPTAVVEDIMGGNDASFKAAPKSAPVPADQDDDFADGLMSRADVLASNLNLVASSPIHLAASLDFASSAEKTPSKAGAEEDPDLPINGVAKAATKLRMGQVTSDNSNSSAPAVDTNGDPVLVLTSHPQDVENNLKGTTMLRFNKTAGDAAKGISVYNKASVGDILKENNVTLPAKPAHIIRSDKYGANPKGCGAGQANTNCSSAAFDSKPTIHDTPTEIVAKVTPANPLPVAPNPSTLMSPKPLLVPQYEDASQRKESLAPFDVPTAGYTFTGSEHVVEFGSKLAPPVPGAIPVSADGKPLTPAPKHVPVPLPADKGHVKWKSGSGQTVLSPSVGNTIPSFKVGETYLKPTQA